MRITVGVTDNDWADFLRARPNLSEVNFWVPSGRTFLGRASVDEPFLFKTKTPVNKLVGGGFLEGFYELRVSEAWEVFGEGNGVSTETALQRSIAIYRSRNGHAADPDPTIGCIVLRNVFFAPEGAEYPQPQHWGSAIVQGKTYEPTDPDWEYIEQAFRGLAERPRLDLVWDRDILDLPDLGGITYREAVRQERLGQGGFRLHVEVAYGRTCAITGTTHLPALEAAHIVPFKTGGHRNVTNGLLLRRDVHRLFDAGYLGIDQQYRLVVSPRLRVDTRNGVEFYERAERGEPIRLPSAARAAPDPVALAWHMEHRFLSA